MDGALGRGVVEQLPASLQSSHGPCVDDRAAALHPLDRGARHVEIAEDVRAERPLELLVGHILDRLLMLLICGVVDQDVDPSEGIDCRLHCVVAESRFAYVTRNQQASASFGNNRAFGHLGVALLFGQVDDGDIGAFAREEDGDGASNSRVASGDERDASI